VHAVLAKQGVSVPVSDLFGIAGQALLDRVGLDGAYAARVGSLRRLIDVFTFEIDTVARRIDAQLAGHPGYRAAAVRFAPGTAGGPGKFREYKTLYNFDFVTLGFQPANASTF
jgi:hypothetical protein